MNERVRAFIEHHGVKGQKWGVRTKRPRGPSSEDSQKHGAAKKKHVSELSDKELKDLVGRLNMEQQFRRASPTTVTKGHNALKGLLAAGVTANAVILFAQSPAGKALGSKLSKVAKKASSIPVSSIGVTVP